jgi:WD40 repeat protein
VALSGDGSLLVSGGFDGTVRLWEAPNGRPLSALIGHTSPVYGVALSEGGRLLASGSFDGSVRLWDFSTRACVCVLRADLAMSKTDVSPASLNHARANSS